MNIKMLAADFGASSGRVMLGEFNGEKLKTEPLYRFENNPVILGDTFYWDFLRLFHELKNGILAARSKGEIESIAVDTWGVDFGLIDRCGRLLENPVHYRDSRTIGMLEESKKYINPDIFYGITGNQFMEINTAFQLLSLVKNRPELLKNADRLLMMPDLFNYFLSGKASAEYTEASTTQLLDAKKRIWSKEVMEKLGICKNLFCDIIMPGTELGTLRKEIAEELGVNPFKVIASAGHDTQSALAAVPAKEKDFLFVSCGTWSLFGTELDEPIINEKSVKYNITNEGGFENKISFLKNIIGLWLIQESRRQWIKDGNSLSFARLETLAETEENHSYIDPDDAVFIYPGNIPERIKTYCAETKQALPLSIGQTVRCINESLALKYRNALEEIEDCTGKKYTAIHIVGGGVKSEMLCRLISDVCGVTVYAGPVEATALGNFGIQLCALGILKNLDEIRAVIRNSEDIKVYEPKDTEKWNKIYSFYKQKILNKE